MTNLIKISIFTYAYFDFYKRKAKRFGGLFGGMEVRTDGGRAESIRSVRKHTEILDRERTIKESE